jgi:hypothetical protein
MSDPTPAPFDPFAFWRDWVVKSEQQWSDNVTRFLKDERTAGPLAKQMREALFAHRMFAEMMQAYLASVNLPSRSDLEWLDERLGKLEDTVASLAAEIVRLRTAIVESGAAAGTALARTERVPRTRKPPPAE